MLKFMDSDLQLTLLASDCADCSVSPPLLPTTCAILRLLALVGACRLALILRVVPCNASTILQQLSRLTAQGLISRSRSREGGRRFSLYTLTPGGRLMVAQWQQRVMRIRLAILRECEQNGSAQ